METRAIFFIGKPGCGKGTQAKLLSEKTGWPRFASGDLFRAIAEEDTPVGRKIKSENHVGILQPPWFAMYLFLKTLFSVPEGTSIVFDGFNRKVPEAELVIASLEWLGRSFAVINIQVTDAEVHRRLALRKGVESRADDAFVERRLEEYHAYTEPAIDIFRKAGSLIEINGEQKPEAVAACVNAVLKT